mmetsp:Transcript_35664/g.98331  ORF Transcript_35664/g.98331 Transcript_35664/m.98331 type:complete len:201 (-) Transcript_35664:1372-1974(-)
MGAGSARAQVRHDVASAQLSTHGIEVRTTRGSRRRWRCCWRPRLAEYQLIDVSRQYPLPELAPLLGRLRWALPLPCQSTAAEGQATGASDLAQSGLMRPLEPAMQRHGVGLDLLRLLVEVCTDGHLAGHKLLELRLYAFARCTQRRPLTCRSQGGWRLFASARCTQRRPLTLWCIGFQIRQATALLRATKGTDCVGRRSR